MQCGSNPQTRTDKQESVALLRTEPLKSERAGSQRNRHRNDYAKSVGGFTKSREGTDAGYIDYCQDDKGSRIRRGAHWIFFKYCRHVTLLCEFVAITAAKLRLLLHRYVLRPRSRSHGE